MTSREEIERLLNQTGRTLEGLPKEYPTDKCMIIRQNKSVMLEEWGSLIYHQSDVIELLVGALRDALDKPMQKPMTYDEDDGYEWIDRDHTSDDGFCNEGARMDEMSEEDD